MKSLANLSMLALLVLPLARQAAEPCPELLNHEFKRLPAGKMENLCQYRGKVVLAVNTASRCGFTPQFDGLQKIYEQYRRSAPSTLPAALEMFHPSRRDTCFVALLRLGEGTATVTVGDGPRIEAPLEQVDALWTRDTVVWWLEPTASRGPDGEAWARQALAGVGHVDAELASAVSGFQLRAGLVPDGLLGPRTRAWRSSR